MSFAIPILKEVPLPKYKGTIVCPHCYAEYKKGGKWVYGNYEGTSTKFQNLFSIAEGKCPICFNNER